MSIFNLVKELVDVPAAARHYGVEVRRGNMALCPFHRERTPSCKLYADHYYCFGCQAHGDVITLVQELFGLTPTEAVKQLDSDFALGLELDKNYSGNSRKTTVLKKQRDEQKAREVQAQKNYDIVLRYYALLDKYIIYHELEPNNVHFAERYRFALENIDKAAYLYSMLAVSDVEEQCLFQQEVDRIEKEYNRVIKMFGE